MKKYKAPNLGAFSFMRIALIFLFCFAINGYSQKSDFEKERDSIIDYGLEAYFNRDVLSLKKTCLLLDSLYLAHKDTISLAKKHHYKALVFKIQNKLDSSYFYYHKSKDLSIKLGDSLEVGRRLLSMGLMQQGENDLVGAEYSLTEGLKFLEPLNENRFTANTYNNLGIVLMDFGRYHEARQSFIKSKKLYEKTEHKASKERGILDYYNNTGYSFLNENEFNKAILFLEKGLKLYNVKDNYSYRYEGLIGNLADAFYALGRKKQAWDLYKELLQIRQREKNIYRLSLSHNGLAKRYMNEDKSRMAIFHAKKGHDLAKKANNNVTRLSALLKLGQLTNGEISKKYFREYANLNDSLRKKERFYKNQFAKIRYETDKKEAENKTLKLDVSQKQVVIEKEKRQSLIAWSTAIAVLLTGGLGYVLIRSKQRKQLFLAQLQKAEAREKERQQIAKSLHDEVAGDIRILHQRLQRHQRIEEAETLNKIKNNVRNLSHQLSSVRFNEVGFKDQLTGLISEYLSSDFIIRQKGINTIDFSGLNENLLRTLLISIRESLQNTYKHAEASRFIIEFSKEKENIVLTIMDDGKGFDGGSITQGIGLKNLQERVQELRGTFVISSSEKGTLTIITLPIYG